MAVYLWTSLMAIFTEVMLQRRVVNARFQIACIALLWPYIISSLLYRAVLRKWHTLPFAGWLITCLCLWVLTSRSKICCSSIWNTNCMPTMSPFDVSAWLTLFVCVYTYISLYIVKLCRKWEVLWWQYCLVWLLLCKMDPLVHLCFEDNNSHIFWSDGILLYWAVLKVCEHSDHQSKVHRSFVTKAHFTQVKGIQLESCSLREYCSFCPLHDKEEKVTV